MSAKKNGFALAEGASILFAISDKQQFAQAAWRQVAIGEPSNFFSMDKQKFRPLPQLERLNELLEIVEIPEDKFGEWSGLVWRVQRGGTAQAGSVAGCLQQDSTNSKRKDWRVTVDGIQYLASRIIYYMTTGEDPGDSQVDHKDQNSLNNNAWNLRLDVDGSVQQVNLPRYRNNTSGVVGVSWNKPSGRWMAKVCENGKQKTLGRYNCKIEAARVVNEKWIEMGWDKKGRELNDLENIKCNCRSCV